MANISHQKARSLILFASEATLSPRDQQMLDSHIETCDPCKTYVETLAVTQQKLRRTLQRRWDPLRAHISLQQIKTGSRRTLMFKKLTITAGTLAVIFVLALVVFSISGSLSPKNITASKATVTPTRVVATAMPQPTPTSIQFKNTVISAISPDGRRFILEDFSPAVYIYDFTHSEGQLTRLMNFRVDQRIEWSADGKINFCLGNDAYSILPDGSQRTEQPNLTRLFNDLIESGTTNCDYFYRHFYSPDYKTAAFSHGLEAHGLYFVDLSSGENLRQVIGDDYTSIIIHQWLEDASGSLIVFSGFDQTNLKSSLPGIYSAKIDSDNRLVRIQRLYQLQEPQMTSWTLSPDGRKLVYSPDESGKIYRVDFSRDGSDIGQPIADVNVLHPSLTWSPDGSQIAFTSNVDSDSDIFVINADGSNLRHYPNPGLNDDVVTWTADGRGLVLRSAEDSYGTPFSLNLVDLKDLQPFVDLRTVTGPGTCVLAPVHYLVTEGDSLAAIAARFDVSVQSIIALNSLDASGAILAGQKLLIPQALNTLVDGVNYTVAKNDTIESIAATFGASAESIRKVNYPGSATTISAGQMLIIPQAGHLPLISNDIESSIAIRWPLTSHSILAQDYSTLHPGLDIVANAGDPVAAGQPGVVTFAGATDGPLGNAVIIQHRNNLETIYAHLGELRVSCFESVRASQVIGNVGQTPGAANPFLYFAIRKDGDPATPKMFMP